MATEADKTDDLIGTIEKFLASQLPVRSPHPVSQPTRLQISDEGLLAWQKENAPHGPAPFARLAELFPEVKRERQLRKKLSLAIGVDQEMWQKKAADPFSLLPNALSACKEWRALAERQASENTDWGAIVYVHHKNPLNKRESLAYSLIYEYRRDDSITYRASRKRGNNIILGATLVFGAHQSTICPSTKLTLYHQRPTDFVDQSLHLWEDSRFPSTTVLAFENITRFILDLENRSGKEPKVTPYPLFNCL